MNRHQRSLVIFVLAFLMGGQYTPTPIIAKAIAHPAASQANLDFCGAGTGTGAITGKITRAADGTPLSGADVIIYNVFGQRIVGVVTMGDGTYKADLLAGGAYMVKASQTLSNNILYTQFYKGQNSANTFTPVQVVDGKTTQNINFALKDGVSVHGTVTDAVTGKPIQDINVIFFDPTSENNGIKGVVTDAQGSYSSGGLPPGSYKVVFTGNIGLHYQTQYYKDKSSFADADTITLTGTQSVTVKAKLTPLVDSQPEGEGKITGKITAADTHAPLSGVFVSASDINKKLTVAVVNTGESGEYTLTVPTGSYKISGFPISQSATDYTRRYFGGDGTPDGAEVINISANGARSGANIELPRGSRIMGRVTHAPDGTGVGSVTVVAQGEGPLGLTAIGITDSSGFYTTPAVAAGTNTVTVASTVCLQTLQGQPQKVNTTPPAPVSNIDLTLSDGGIISGRQTNATSGAGVRGTVVIEDQDGKVVATILVGETGYYHSLGLAPGKYYVHFKQDKGSGLGSIYYGQAKERDDAKLVEVKAEQLTSKVDATLPPAEEEEEQSVLYMPSLETH